MSTSSTEKDIEIGSEKGSLANTYPTEVSSTRGSELIGSDVEKRLLRKLDWTLVPLATLIYSVNFADRVAIGNSKIAGLEKDLGLHGNDYNNALTIFYLLFAVFEVPCNLVFKRVGSIFMGVMVIAFGLVTLCTAFVHNYQGLIATRVFLGIAEAGSLPGLLYIMSRYYRRNELILRVGLFLGIAPNISGAFAGLICSGILATGDIGGIKSWRKIFLVEGIITIGLGLIFLFIVPSEDPKKTKLLTEEERLCAVARMEADQFVKTGGSVEESTWTLVKKAFNFNTFLYTIGFTCLNISFQGLSVFLPTVVAHLGKYTTVQAQLRTVPPYCVGLAWVLVCTLVGWKVKRRFVPILMAIPLAITGYAISIATKNPHARYAACFLFIAGLTPCAPQFTTWGVDNTSPDTVRAMAMGIIPGIGNIGSVIAVWTFLPKDAPDYHRGNIINLCTTTLILCVLITAVVYCSWENKQREQGKRDHRLQGKTPEEIAQLGHDHPDFRFQL